MFDLVGVDAALQGHMVLRNIHLAVQPGEFVALVGPNGAGKSTLLGVLAGDIPATYGTARFQGRDLAGMRLEELARQRAVLTQGGITSFPYTVKEIVAMGCLPQARGQSRGDIQLVVQEALREMGVEHLAARSYPTLSGGEARRVDMARVIAQQTRTILLDEPTNHLDVRHEMSLLSWCRRHVEAGGTIVCALHDLNHAALFATRLVLLSHGCIVIDGTAEEVLQSGILGSVYGLRCTVTRHPSGCPWVIPHAPRPTITVLPRRSSPLVRPGVPSNQGDVEHEVSDLEA